MNRKFEVVEKGTRIAGVEIIGTSTASTAIVTHIYHVRHDCCGAERDMSHHSLLERQRKNAKYCGDCSRKLNAGGRNRSTDAQRGITLIAELPPGYRPRARLTEADIEQHLARVFR